MRTTKEIYVDYYNVTALKQRLREEEIRVEQTIQEKLSSGHRADKELERLLEIDKEYQDACNRYVEIVDELMEVVES